MLAAAALFNPLRLRVQKAVDRRFSRAHYDAGQTIAAFSAQLTDAVDLDTVCRDLLQVVQGALEPAQTFVWIKESSSTTGHAPAPDPGEDASTASGGLG